MQEQTMSYLGVSTTGRDIPVDNITEMFGLCIHTVPVRMVFDKSSNLLQYLKQCQGGIW